MLEIGIIFYVLPGGGRQSADYCSLWKKRAVLLTARAGLDLQYSQAIKKRVNPILKRFFCAAATPSTEVHSIRFQNNRLH